MSNQTVQMFSEGMFVEDQPDPASERLRKPREKNGPRAESYYGDVLVSRVPHIPLPMSYILVQRSNVLHCLINPHKCPPPPLPRARKNASFYVYQSDDDGGRERGRHGDADA